MSTALKTASSLAQTHSASASPFARAVQASKSIRWDIDKDVIRDRGFDPAHLFLPDGLSRISRMQGLSADEKRLMSQIQGRTYANMFHLCERFVNAKALDVTREHAFGDQTALEGFVRLSDDELKHQALFRRIESLIGRIMPPGYEFPHDPDAVAAEVMASDNWSVLTLILNIELVTQKHFKESIETNPDLSPLFKDVFRFHWKEEAPHAIMDELELRRVDAALTPAERDRGVDQLIQLVLSVDGILRIQAAADARYFFSMLARSLAEDEQARIERDLLSAYRWQYILTGAEHPTFLAVLTDLIDESQAQRIGAVLATLN